MRTTDEPVRVLYVSGWVYSGSTLLSNILGEVEGIFAAGEVRLPARERALAVALSWPILLRHGDLDRG